MQYRSMYKPIFCLLVLAQAVMLPVQAANEQEIADMFIQKSNSVVDQLSQLKAQEALSSQTALVVIQKEMSPILDFTQLTKRAMGKYWRRTDEPLRRDIVAAFRMLLENTYAKVLAQYSGQQVELLETKALTEDKISVVLKVQNKSKSAEINYIFSPSEGGDYLVGDIKIEGISLVANYRRQFKAVISKYGVEALAERLANLAEAKIQ